MTLDGSGDRARLLTETRNQAAWFHCSHCHHVTHVSAGARYPGPMGLRRLRHGLDALMVM
jgi:cytochrome c553